MHYPQCPVNNKNYHRCEFKEKYCIQSQERVVDGNTPKDKPDRRNWQTRIFNNHDKHVLKMHSL